MLCYSLYDDPNREKFSSLEEITQCREAMMLRTATLKERHFSCVYLDMHRVHVCPVGVTTTHGFVLLKQNRRFVFACVPLWDERDSAYKAYLENRKPRSPWRLFENLKLSPKLVVLATACYRDLMCVLFNGRLVVARHYQGEWSVVADRPLPFGGAPWVPLSTVGLCAQCVMFAYQHTEEKQHYLYAIPLNEASSKSTPLKVGVNREISQIVLPEEIYDHHVVFGAIHDRLGKTSIVRVNLKEEGIQVGEEGECPWPDHSPTDFMRVFRTTVCYYSRERKQLLFYRTEHPDSRSLRLVTDDVLSVEMFNEYALVHYANDELELMNMHGEYRARSKLLRAMTRQFADIATHNLHKNSPVRPFHSTRTFSSSLFVMFHDGTLCQFQSKE